MVTKKMKKKILIGSIFAVLLMLSMPSISNIQAKTMVVSEVKETEECSICAKGIIKDLICGYIKWGMNIAQR